MATIANYFTRILHKQRQLGYFFPEIVQAGASESQIREAEKALGFRFNAELLQLYSFANGTQDDYETPCGKTGLLPIHNFLNLQRAIDHRKAIIDFDDYFRDYETGYAPGKQLFPILDDHAGNCYWVDLNGHTENYGKLYWTNTFAESPCYHYESLTSMFQVICECYERGVFFLDEEGYLSCDDTAFGEISRKYHPTIRYWEAYLGQ